MTSRSNPPERVARIREIVDTVPRLYQPLWTKAMNGHPFSRKNAIKAKCLECSNFQREEVRNCQVYDCPLWLYRPYEDEDAPGPPDAA